MLQLKRLSLNDGLDIYQMLQEISSNDNGTIKVTITYDDTFKDGEDVELTFDAATGNQVTQ
jgi:hypothetical protein